MHRIKNNGKIKKGITLLTYDMTRVYPKADKQ